MVGDDLFKQTFEHSATAQVLVEDGWIRAANHAAHALLRAASDALTGRPINEVFGPASADGAGPAAAAVHAKVAGQHRTRWSALLGAPPQVTVQADLRRLPEPGLTSITLYPDTGPPRADLYRAEKLEALSTFARGIAHDFNNNVGVIIANAEMLAFDTVDAVEDSQEALELLLKAAHRTRALVTQLMAFARDDSLATREMDLSVLVRQTVKMLRSALPPAVQLRAHITRRPLMLTGTPDEMHQILMHLIANALYAMGDTGPLSLVLASTHRDGADGALLTIHDSGRGIPPELMSRIFDPFFTTKGQQAGSGLGLSVVHGIVTAHGGQIDAHSIVGEGTTFEVFLPARIVQPEEPASNLDTRVAALPRGTERIIFVDDEPSLVMVGRALLMRLGYEVTTFTDPQRALSTIAADPGACDLVITDWRMPELSGLELIEVARTHRAGVPAILTTGSIMPLDTPARCEVLTKPLSLATLAHLVRTMLDLGAPTPSETEL